MARRIKTRTLVQGHVIELSDAEVKIIRNLLSHSDSTLLTAIEKSVHDDLESFFRRL